MTPDTNDLTTNELTVLESLHGAPQAVSQRELARQTGFSVGLINAVIKKLVQTGYVKTSHLNRRQLEYLLTSEGFARTATKSYHYIVETAKRYKTIQLKLRGLLDGLMKEGYTQFYLHGDGELAEIVAIFFAEEEIGELKTGLPQNSSGTTVVLNAALSKVAGSYPRVVDLVKELGGNGRK